MNSKSNRTTTLLSVYDGRICIGFVLPRGKLGWEAFDADENSVGTSKTQAEAAAALMGAAVNVASTGNATIAVVPPMRPQPSVVVERWLRSLSRGRQPTMVECGGRDR